MSRVPSINHQVGEIIKAHNGIRKSKLASRNESGIRSLESGHKLSDKFHSYKSLDNARADLKSLGNYAKMKYGIKNMKEINANIVRDWILSRDITYRTASNNLSEINKVHQHLSITLKEVAELRAELRATLENLPKETRAYAKLDKIKLKTEKSQIVFELQRDYGLRVKAASYINIEKQLEGNTLHYQEKGGKWSEKELSPTLAQQIRENAKNERFSVSYDKYREHLKEAIEVTNQKFNGTHGIRHSYAQVQMSRGMSKEEVSEAMGHVRSEITNTYLR